MEKKNKFKVGDLVRCISKDPVDIGDKNKIGKIIYIGNSSSYPYTVEFFELIPGGHSGMGYGEGKRGHCWNLFENEIELYHQPILKIFLKEKNL